MVPSRASVMIKIVDLLLLISCSKSGTHSISLILMVDGDKVADGLVEPLDGAEKAGIKLSLLCGTHVFSGMPAVNKEGLRALSACRFSPVASEDLDLDSLVSVDLRLSGRQLDRGEVFLSFSMVPDS